MKTNSAWKTFRNGSTAIAAVVLVVGIVAKFLTDKAGIHSQFCHDMILYSILWIGILWTLVIIGWELGFGYRTGQAIGRASMPIPTPGQVYDRLTVELGREPTISEVSDVHQMLVSSHNQDMLNAGAGIGLLLLANHAVNDHG